MKIRNVTTGKIIKTLKTPEYELVRAIPGFEIIILISAILLILFLKRKRQI